MPMPPEHRAFLQKHLEPYSRDNHVWDFCCGIGHNGIVSLKHNARWVTFTDVREKTFRQWLENKPEGEITNTNYCWKYFDADQIDKYLPEIPTQDLDIIIYCGHFYHARNHYEIAKMLTQTSARHLILESKTTIPHITPDPEMKMTIDWHVEGTKTWTDTYEENPFGPGKKLHSLVGAPNFLWTITCFEMLGWTKEDAEIIDMIKRHKNAQFNKDENGVMQKVHDSLYQYRIKFVRNV